ncbi:MAG: hypothetical protein PHO86_01185 [Bacilli bacterium]|nr:hypothetical protein [Bacilli bacterium]
MYQRHVDKKTNLFLHAEKEEIKLIGETKTATTKHISFLTKQLKKNKNLQAFDKMISLVHEENAEEAFLYVYSITEVFVNIVKEFYHKATIYQAYFAYLITKYPINLKIEQGKIREFLLEICTSKSIYCRENALYGLAMIGDAKICFEALNALAISGRMTQVKLLTECLIDFKGNNSELLNYLLNNFNNYPRQIKISIIDYARFVSCDSVEEIYEILKKETDEEVLYSCLRYFGKHKYNDALEYIINFGNKALQDECWGFVAVISSVLKLYKYSVSTNFLYKAVICPDWSSRENAAKTLIHFFGKRTLQILSKYQDKYANEMIQYQLNTKDLVKE